MAWAVMPVAVGATRPASGSVKEAAPVTGVALSLALPLVWTLPSTWMALAVTLALPPR